MYADRIAFNNTFSVRPAPLVSHHDDVRESRKFPSADKTRRPRADDIPPTHVRRVRASLVQRSFSTEFAFDVV